MSNGDAGPPTAPASQTKLSLPLSFVEFVGLIAAMMSLTALAIDIMLPALPDIGKALNIASENDRQLIVIVYVIGFAAGQLVYGPLSDRYGRKPLLMVGFGIFLVASLLAILAPSFKTLLIARAMQGIGAAAPRVMALAIVRDVVSGRQMARVMSLAMAVFIIIPVFAPAMGQGLMMIGTWRTPFDLLLVFALVIATWAAWRLPETRPASSRATSPSFMRSVMGVVTNGQTAAYTIGAGFLFSSLLAYVAVCQQIFVGIYGLGAWFPVAFGGIASVMAVASYVNFRLVERLGMRLVSHVALSIYVVASLFLLVASVLGLLPLWLFALLISIAFFTFGLIQPNFNALAMEPQGQNAGTASSLIGAYTTGFAAVMAGVIGQSFDGTVVPLATGYAVGALATVLAIWFAEGRAGLFGRTRT